MDGCLNSLFTLKTLIDGRRDRREYQKEDQDGLYKNKEAKRITQSTVKRI